ncbi:retention module-containing protein, partial [Aeromonas simiae]
MRTQKVENTATVTEIQGQAWVMAGNTHGSQIKKGDVLQKGVVIELADDAKIWLVPVDHQNTTPEHVPVEQAIAPSQEGTPQENGGQTAQTAPTGDIAALQQAILQGVDPTQAFQASAAGGAPAAGPGGGGIGGVAGSSGNGGFVVIDRVGDATLAEAGFDTTYGTIPLVDQTIDASPILDNQLSDGNETVTVIEGESVSGNVLDNTVNPDGPDESSVLTYNWGINVGVPAGVPATLTGIGTLIINVDGSFTFTPVPNYDGDIPSISYVVFDGVAQVGSTLTIVIDPIDSPVSVNSEDLTVSESHFPDGSDPNQNQLSQSGVFTFSAQDGVQTLSVGGTLLMSDNSAAPLPISITTPLGNTLVINSINFNSITGQGSVSYTYTLLESEQHTQPVSDSLLQETLSVVLADVDGDTSNATLNINILDDVPSLNVIVNSPTINGFMVTLDETQGNSDHYATGENNDSYVNDDNGHLAQVTTTFNGGLLALFSIGGSYGADGAGSISSSLSLVGIPSGGSLATTLSATDGGAIRLAMAGNDVVGLDSDGDVVLRLAIVDLGDGEYQLQTTQYEA